MTVSTSEDSPSVLSQIIGRVKDVFSACGNPIPIMVGKAYAGDIGCAHVMFVPALRGRVGPGEELGSAASVSRSCDVYVRAAETGDDLTRIDNAETLADFVIDAISASGGSHIEWGDSHEDSPVDVDALGADLVISFVYTRDIRHGRAWTAPTNPQQGTLNSLDVSTQLTE